MIEAARQGKVVRTRPRWRRAYYSRGHIICIPC